MYSGTPDRSKNEERTVGALREVDGPLNADRTGSQIVPKTCRNCDDDVVVVLVAAADFIDPLRSS